MPTLPTDGRVNQVADAVVKALRVISRKKDARWLTSPAAVHRSLLLKDLTMGERPRLAVRVLSWEDQPTSPQRHQASAVLGVTCIVNDVEGAEPELNRLVRDVVMAITNDEALKGTVVSIYPSRYELEVDMMEKSGLGVATVTLDAMYMWDHGAP